MPIIDIKQHIIHSIKPTIHNKDIPTMHITHIYQAMHLIIKSNQIVR